MLSNGQTSTLTIKRVLCYSLVYFNLKLPSKTK